MLLVIGHSEQFACGNSLEKRAADCQARSIFCRFDIPAPRRQSLHFNALLACGNVQNFILKMDSRDRQFCPILRQIRMKRESISSSGAKTEKSIQHHLRRQNALDELLVQSEPARHIGALQRPARRIFVLFAISTGGLNFVEPFGDFAKARSGVIRPKYHQPRHQIVIRPSQHRAAVLHLIAPGNILRRIPRP